MKYWYPKAELQKETMYIPGTDGDKMSKSKGNSINIFLQDKQLHKQIMKIQTDSTPLEDPKNPDTCNLFALYKLLASPEQVAEMRIKYEQGGYGYGHAKQAFYELLIEEFAEIRTRYDYFMENKAEIDSALAIGAEKARVIAQKVLKRTREKLGY